MNASELGRGKDSRKEIILETGKKFPHFYGQVPSRHFGYSLGVEIHPFKTCSFNCIYCKLVHTPETTMRRGRFFLEKPNPARN